MEHTEKARRRMELITKVLAGELQATQAAEALGISRQAYYDWERRYLEASLAAMEDRPSGRPTTVPQVDAETERLRKENTELAKQVEMLGKTVDLKELLAEYRATMGDASLVSLVAGKKNSGRRRTK